MDLHAKRQFGNHAFAKIGKDLTNEQISWHIENLSLKVKIAHECKKKIIHETERLVDKIQNMCMEALKAIQKKQENYKILLRILDEELFDDKINELERESTVVLSIKMPVQRFKEIEKFYATNFLQEVEKVAYISSMLTYNAVQFLAEDYGLKVEGHTGPVIALAIISDNKFIVSGSHDKTVRIWSLQYKTQDAILRGHTDHVTNLAITSDDKWIVSGSQDTTVRIWNFYHKIQEAVLQGHKHSILWIVITSDNNYIVSGSLDCTIIVWKLKEKTQEKDLQIHRYNNIASITTSDNKHIIYFKKFSALVCNLQNKVVSRSCIHGKTPIAITSDKKYIISPEREYIRICRFEERKTLHSLYNGSFVDSIALTSDDAYIVTGSSDNNVRIWYIQSKTLESKLIGHTAAVNLIAITSDNKYIVSGSRDKTIRIWSFRYKRQEAVLQGHTAYTSSFIITSHDNYIVSGSMDNEIRIWSLYGRSQEADFPGHSGSVKSIAVTSDNKYIVSGSRDKTVRIWSLQYKTQEAVLRGHTDIITSVAITSDNKYIASGSRDMAVRIWKLYKKN